MYPLRSSSFHVLEGRFAIEADGAAHHLQPGDHLSIAPGVLHSLRNAGDGWGRLLIKTSPGARHLRFFEAVGAPLAPGADPTPLTAPPAYDSYADVGRACGMDFVAPGA